MINLANCHNIENANLIYYVMKDVRIKTLHVKLIWNGSEIMVGLESI